MPEMCNDTLVLVLNNWFWTGEALKLLLAPSVVLANALFALVVCRSACLPPCLHALLINISMSAILSGILYTAKTVFVLLTVLNGEICEPALEKRSVWCHFQVDTY